MTIPQGVSTQTGSPASRASLCQFEVENDSSGVVSALL